MFLFKRPTSMPSPDDALPGRSEPMKIPDTHFVNGARITRAVARWDADRRCSASAASGAPRRTFWQTPGVISTAVGYAGGYTPNPTYDEVCSGKTGHAEVVLVAFDPTRVTYEQLLKVFWEHHDPTQGMRQGNDVGTQYRSVILVATRRAAARRRGLTRRLPGRADEGRLRRDHDRDRATPAPFYYAEDYHQQYLAKNPHGYCPDHSTGVACPVGLGVPASASGAVPIAMVD